MSFKELGLRSVFDEFYKEAGYKNPTKVQSKVIPLWMKGKSLLVLSETGSGKTLSFALPLCEQVKKTEEKFGISKIKSTPHTLVLAPTRELASQIFGEFKKISHHLKLRVRLLAGGDSFEKTKNLGHSSYDILIATPSRVKSALKKKELSLSQLRALVLDESDNLFEMGFKKDLAEILDFVDITLLQVGCFSATRPQEFMEFVEEKFPNKNFEDVHFESSHRIQQRIDTYNVKVTPTEKNMVVKMFLEKEAKGRGIIFTNQKNQAEDLFKFIKEKMPKLRTLLLHGDLPAEKREEAISNFIESKAQILIATDVAARGIDISDLHWIVNYGLPKSAIYYLHRAGRVARGGGQGVVYNLVASHDSKMIEEINTAIRSQKHLNLKVIPSEKPKDKTKFRRNV